jgi:hypothetical protein
MRTATEIAALEEHSGRAAGTDAERRAAVHLRGRLRALGREAELQPIDVRPRYGLAHALHALLAIAGSVLATHDAVLGTALVLAAAFSASLDIAGVMHLGRRLTGRRASQNVESREQRGRAGVVILVAGYDAPRRAPLAPFRDPWAALLAAILAVLACCALRAAGLEGVGLTIAQFVPTVALILLLLPLLDVELSKPGGDATGAAGVTTVLRVAEELGERLEHFDLWVVFTGARHPFGLGMRRWLRRRRRELEGRRAVVVSVGPVGAGAVRYARRDGPVLPRRSDPELVRICAEIAEDDRNGAYEAAPATRRHPGDGFAAISHGVPALTVWSEGELGTAEGVDRAARFCRELIERLDADAGRLRRA